MARVSVKSHANGALSPKAHLRRPLTEHQVLNAPMVAWPLGVYDCCGVSDGAACAIVTTPERAREMGRREAVGIRAMQLASSNGVELSHESWDGAHTPNTRIAARRAYAEAGIQDPRREISVMEVHDCFSVTELVLMEDLGMSDEGRAPQDILDGAFDRHGRNPCQTDGGLKCFGHPVGASGLRMAYEVYSQLLGRAGERQLRNPALGLTHNLGGIPGRNVASVSVFGLNKL
jgi:acetyl-CoA C-acetyltransferase